MLERLRSLRLPTIEDATVACMSLMRVLLWLPARMLYVILGTYMSDNPDVRKAGLVADINALALAVAVILLLTSRATFNQAEQTISLQGWGNLIQFGPSRASVCASLNQKPFAGKIFSDINFRCEDARHGTALPAQKTTLNANNTQQVLHFLRSMHEDCHAFAMAVEYNIHLSSAVCYTPEDRILKTLYEVDALVRAGLF